MSGSTHTSFPKGKRRPLVKSYSDSTNLSYKHNSSVTPFASKTIVNCHPTLNGYRENITFCDRNGNPIAKKIVVRCIRCTEVHDKLHVKQSIV